MAYDDDAVFRELMRAQEEQARTGGRKTPQELERQIRGRAQQARLDQIANGFVPDTPLPVNGVSLRDPDKVKARVGGYITTASAKKFIVERRLRSGSNWEVFSSPPDEAQAQRVVSKGNQGKTHIYRIRP
ncbi:hypothetical protein D3C87_1239420 [compost metagenome]